MLVMLNFWLLKNKSQKLEEQSKIINKQPKTIENPDIIDIKAGTI